VNARVRANPEKFVQEYLDKWGTTISTDAAAQLFPEYNQSKEHRTKNRRAVHAAAQFVADSAYWRLLGQPAEGAVRFMAGGTASGKSTVVEGIAEGPEPPEIVYDTTLNHFPSAAERIDAALESGRPVEVFHVLAYPIAAFDWALDRAMDIGRIVPADYHLMTHRESPRTILKLVEHYAGNDRVTFRFFDNTGTSPKFGSIDALRGLANTGVGEQLQKLLDQRLQAGSISRLVSDQRMERGEAGGARRPGRRTSRRNAEELEESPSAVLDPSTREGFVSLLRAGAEKLASGITSFAEWSRAMLAEFGDRIRPHLK
jgi:hypothetical protein